MSNQLWRYLDTLPIQIFQYASDYAYFLDLSNRIVLLTLLERFSQVGSFCVAQPDPAIIGKDHGDTINLSHMVLLSFYEFVVQHDEHSWLQPPVLTVSSVEIDSSVVV